MDYTIYGCTDHQAFSDIPATLFLHTSSMKIFTELGAVCNLMAIYGWSRLKINFEKETLKKPEKS